ncbi:DUF2975 domain-containing protein [Bizionia arctica]|uniref:DUF2975 domain-containing protein n=1 Tax=Bizionia arctica TaxID=1495645 RepID=A0A917LT04_9FLAO|nr:DUF2975 domain-containing protein [Bizionia arctica]GGG53657.1 hypothetical protein GCM10010976_25780 [Bizionia arctica]
MKTQTDLILTAMKVIFWVVFIGLCIKTGALLISFIVSLAVNPEAASNLYLGLDLSELQNTNQWYYIHVASFIISISALKGYLAFLVLKIFSKIDFKKPFTEATSLLISKISHIALGIGVLAIIASRYNIWLIRSKESILDTQYYLDGGKEFLLLAGIIFIISLIFKKGIDLQTENELTV